MMRYHELTSGIRIPLSGEEQEIIDLVNKNMLDDKKFDERQEEVARTMVGRGILDRHRNGLKVSSLDKIERN